VEELEIRMAKILGKERAVFMPTGTMANHLAVRKLAGENKKVIVQAESHLYRDSGDCATTLSNLNLIALGKNKTGFTLNDVKEVVARTKAGRVHTQVGVISIESPVRRQQNRMFDFDEMQAISKFARNNTIKMHLDGARLFNACVHGNKNPEDFASLFDTVYVSLYKNFNAASGAILAGSKEFTKDLYHTRRMFGGGMPQVWPFAAVALNYLDSFIGDYQKSLRQADKFFESLSQNKNIEINKLTAGTNVMEMKLPGINQKAFTEQLAARNIIMPEGDQKSGLIYFKINPSILRQSVDRLSTAFIESLKQAKL